MVTLGVNRWNIFFFFFFMAVFLWFPIIITNENNISELLEFHREHDCPGLRRALRGVNAAFEWGATTCVERQSVTLCVLWKDERSRRCSVSEGSSENRPLKRGQAPRWQQHHRTPCPRNNQTADTSSTHLIAFSLEDSSY